MAHVYIDENLTGEFVSKLQELGHDVADGANFGPGKTDAWHFRTALAERRIIITLDKRGLDGWATAVDEGLMRGDDLSGHMYRWLSGREEWLEDAWRPEN